MAVYCRNIAKQINTFVGKIQSFSVKYGGTYINH
jgi:hypothetical protein